MVATRIERAEKLARQTAPVPPTPLRVLAYVGTPRPVAPAPRSGSTSTTVNSYQVLTSADGNETSARPLESESGARIHFSLPTGLTRTQAHEAAVRFLRRRGPDFAPAGDRVLITLDARGRHRGEERF